MSGTNHTTEVELSQSKEALDAAGKQTKTKPPWSFLWNHETRILSWQWKRHRARLGSEMEGMKTYCKRRPTAGFSSHNLRWVLGLWSRKSAVHPSLAWHSVTQLCNVLELCFPIGRLQPVWKVQSVFCTGVYMRCWACRNEASTPPPWDWELRVLGVRRNKIMAVIKVVEGKEGRHVIRTHWEPVLVPVHVCCLSHRFSILLPVTGITEVASVSGREMTWSIGVLPHSTQ